MNIEFYSDSFLRHQIANVHCGHFANAIVQRDPLATNIYSIPNPPTGTEPIGVVTSSGRVSLPLVNTDYLDGATPFELGNPDIGSSTKHYLYTIGGTRFWYIWKKDAADGRYGYFTFSRADVRSGSESGYTICNLQYDASHSSVGFIASNSNNDGLNTLLQLDLQNYEVLGLYFVAGEISHTSGGVTSTYDAIIGLLVLNPIGNTNPINWTVPNTPRFYTSNIIEGFYELPDYEPTNNNVRRGGRGDGNYGGTAPENIDVATRNAAYSFGNHTGNGLAFYEISNNAYAEFLNGAYNFNFWSNPQLVMSCMMSCFMLPFTLDSSVQKSDNIEKVFCASSEFPVDTAYILYDRFMSGQFTEVSLEQSGYDDYNDFVNTSATLLLPFVGRIEIDIHAIARGSIRVEWIVDLYTANITYWVYTHGMDTQYEVLYTCVSGNCGAKMPLSGYNPWNQSGLGMIVSVAAPAIKAGINSFNGSEQNMSGLYRDPLGDAGAAGVGGAVDATAKLLIEQGKVSRATNFDANSSILGQYECRLDIERLEVVRVEDYRDIAGIPAFNTQKVSSLSGFVKVHSAKWETLSCAQDEKELIAELFASGVYM